MKRAPKGLRSCARGSPCLSSTISCRSETASYLPCPVVQHKSNPGYSIPNVDAQVRKFRVLWLLAPTVALLIAAFGYMRRGMAGFYDLLSIGVGTGFVVTVGVALIVVTVFARRQKAVWAEHTFDWYRTTFPAHAHAKGRVTCRHCGSDHVRAERMLNHTFMRTHACAQCGTTLYFSAEQR